MALLIAAKGGNRIMRDDIANFLMAEFTRGLHAGWFLNAQVFVNLKFSLEYKITSQLEIKN